MLHTQSTLLPLDCPWITLLPGLFLSAVAYFPFCHRGTKWTDYSLDFSFGPKLLPGLILPGLKHDDLLDP